MEPLTYQMGIALIRCRALFKFSQPDGYNAVRVVVCWHVTKEQGKKIGAENGMLETPMNLYGCPVKVAEPETMGVYLFALLNPDGTGVAATADNKLIHVRMVEGKLTPTNKQESSNET